MKQKLETSPESNAAWTPRPVDPLMPRYEPQDVAMPVAAGWLTKNGGARISGSDHGRWIVERCCTAFRELHSSITFDVDLRGTPSAMAFLVSGKSMLSVMGREATAIEITAFKERTGSPPIAVRIAHTAEETSQHLGTSLAVYVHRSNPLSRLSVEQVSKVFSIGNPSGDYSRWGQLGLDGAWAKRLIHPIGTPEYTGFGTYMQKHHLDGRPLSPFYERYIGTNDVLARLEADPCGIAVAAIGCETDDIRLVPISETGTEMSSSGSTEDVRNGRYAFGRFLYFYLNRTAGEPLDPLLAEFLRFVLSFEGQSIVAAQPRGYIPLRPDEIMEERRVIRNINALKGN
ncbi:PstS family phosphate ABC transporter substrate-binding protein [Brucellaceae bacterium D45D]